LKLGVCHHFLNLKPRKINLKNEEKKEFYRRYRMVLVKDIFIKFVDGYRAKNDKYIDDNVLTIELMI
jgi:hypothetical protein